MSATWWRYLVSTDVPDIFNWIVFLFDNIDLANLYCTVHMPPRSQLKGLKPHPGFGNSVTGICRRTGKLVCFFFPSWQWERCVFVFPSVFVFLYPTVFFWENLAAEMLFHRAAPLWILLPPTAAPAVLASRVLQQLVVPEGALSFSTTGKLRSCEPWCSLFLVIRHNCKYKYK